MECSIGVITTEKCHKIFYSVTSRIKRINDLSAENQQLLKKRILNYSNVETICTFHEKKYLDKYHHLFGNKCCDPFIIHKKRITKMLREITVQFADSNSQLLLIPGNSLCTTCYKKISIQQNREDNGCPDIDEYVPEDVQIESVNQACNALGVSPLKIQKISAVRRKEAVKRKVSKISNKVQQKLESSFHLSDESEEYSDTSDEYALLIEELKNKIKLVKSFKEKVWIISLLPKSWPIPKVCAEFQVSEYLVRQTRKLVKENGILPTIQRKQSGKKISQQVVNKVISFYEDDESSRMFPGKKDYVSVRNNEGKRKQKQKKLLLCNLKELYAKFHTLHPEIKIGFSKFCQFCPKWCVLAGAPGTHSVCVCVCVCSIHQNVKLMVNGADLNCTYKDLLNMMVCAMENEHCMLNLCSSCPGPDKVKTFLNSYLEQDDCFDMKITYKQWVTTDRCNLITIVEPYDEFIQNLIEKLTILRKHHYISTSQAEFLKTKKATLRSDECIIVGDFSENFTFVIQDEIQSYHWVNAQATLHPFVVYYKGDDDEIQNKSICVISDYLHHNTVAVYTFQKKVLEEVKSFAASVRKVYYFTDGAASQYKNRKNFINLCNHKMDFDLDAEWHFFATSHGKGPCDGIGGTVKRIVTKASLQRTEKDHILTPEDMYNFCAKNISGILFFYINAKNIEHEETMLQERFLNATAIVNTRDNHCFIPKDLNIIRVQTISSGMQYMEVPISKFISNSESLQIEVKVNDYVACVYDSKWWLGVITEYSQLNKDFNIHFFHPSGPSTSFQLSNNDTAWVQYSHILRLLTPVELYTATGRVHTISCDLNTEISSLLNSYLLKSKNKKTLKNDMN